MSRQNRRESGGDSIRTFICIEMPEPLRERIARLQQALKPVGAQASWVKPANIHLTLKFLGDIRQRQVEAARAATERAAASAEPFDIEIAGAGCFPSAKSPRVLWVGLSSIPYALRQLRSALEDELAREGFPREPKRFAPHLTIARIRSQQNAQQLVEAMTASGFEPERFTVEEIIVMRSQLNPAGSIYTPQAIISLTR